MSPDIINALFEVFGGYFIYLHVKQAYRDKVIKGVSVAAISFMTVWGIWNLYYYPSLDQWWSFLGGVVIVIMNFIWVSLVIYYKKKERNHG